VVDDLTRSPAPGARASDAATLGTGREGRLRNVQDLPAGADGQDDRLPAPLHDLQAFKIVSRVDMKRVKRSLRGAGSPPDHHAYHMMIWRDRAGLDE
jgi:hypothetical protein